jgi:hypothetical protein
MHLAAIRFGITFQELRAMENKHIIATRGEGAGDIYQIRKGHRPDPPETVFMSETYQGPNGEREFLIPAVLRSQDKHRDGWHAVVGYLSKDGNTDKFESLEQPIGFFQKQLQEKTASLLSLVQATGDTLTAEALEKLKTAYQSIQVTLKALQFKLSQSNNTPE